MDKRYLVIPLVIALIAGAWYGLSILKFNRAIKSGRNLLLVNEAAKIYTYSNLLDADDIDRSFTIAGYVDEMTPAEIQAKVSGYNLAGGDLITAGLVQPASSPVQVPTTAQEPAWKAALASLTDGQRALCTRMPTPEGSQYCLVRHLVLNAIVAGKDVAACQIIFTEAHRLECERDVNAKNKDLVTDKENNGLIDIFEMYAQQGAGATQ